ncbi:hypothetical protein N1028_11345 [Herbiconiux sp. CPCC 203407]|uniref:DUF4190 domain-containing protein n=1 Tax=Herbiconiux oxytropis TaxID=2970915 RepID=A0AA42BWL3_9MICO|nr:hypothetical protein [Herbiconiux oxytropis]MCS5722548.1 hypothetical protein [Herbiconiux oxytropis]MCS5726488.1 hypothetical protein [Herbiconiux oxytropis]
MTSQPPPYQPAPQTPQGPTTPATAAAARNRFGLAALIAGIVAFVGAFIPIFNFLAVLIALAAVVLGIIGIIRTGPKGSAVAGAVLGFIALVLSSILAIVYTFLFFGNLLDPAGSPDGVLDTTEIPLVYQVEGTGSDVDITYTISADGVETTEQVTSQRLPFEEDFDVAFGGADTYASYTLTAVNGADDGTVICRIILDGRILVEQESSGAYATASCTTSASELLDQEGGSQ